MKRQPSLVSRILADMHTEVAYTGDEIAAAHFTDPKLVKEILDKCAEQGICSKSYSGHYRKLKQAKKRKRAVQIDWVGR